MSPKGAVFYGIGETLRLWFGRVGFLGKVPGVELVVVVWWCVDVGDGGGECFTGPLRGQSHHSPHPHHHTNFTQALSWEPNLPHFGGT